MKTIYLSVAPESILPNKVVVPMDDLTTDMCTMCIFEFRNAHSFKQADSTKWVTQINMESNMVSDFAEMSEATEFGPEWAAEMGISGSWLGTTKEEIIEVLPEFEGQEEITNEDGTSRMVDKLTLPVLFGE